MFRFTGKPSSGGYSHYLAKNTHLVKNRYVEALQDVVNVMVHIVTCEACVSCTQCTIHTRIIFSQVLTVAP